jgi:peptidylprolyl isomerase
MGYVGMSFIRKPYHENWNVALFVYFYYNDETLIISSNYYMNKLNRNEWIGVVVAVVVVGFFLGNLVYKNNSTDQTATVSVSTDTTNNPATTDQSQSTAVTPADQINNTNQTTQVNNTNLNPTKLIITDTTLGTGTAAKAGDHVYVNYTGTLTDGTKFDSSYDRGAPIDFILGQGRVIKGWDQGLVGLKVGGKRHLIIPASLAYGSNAVGPIPANSTLVFDVELVSIGK